MKKTMAYQARMVKRERRPKRIRAVEEDDDRPKKSEF